MFTNNGCSDRKYETWDVLVVHHTVIAYGAGGDWIYKDVDESELQFQ
ncbi:hypothetical protein [Alkalihalobacterium bogoriense]|nr:hypothetical protein [Alkalihalobacterium bogoriense]